MNIDTPEVKEVEVKGWPGWTKIQMGSSRRYKSPGGVDISAREFMRLATLYKNQGYIPDSVIKSDEARKPKGQFFGSTVSSTSSTKASPEPKVNQESSEPRTKEYTDLIEPEPRARSHTGSKKHPRPTQVALSIGFKKLALLITAVIIARMVNDDRAALSEEEATALGIALGNLLVDSDWNEKYGWLVAETGDWQMVGYIAFKWCSRMFDVMKDKADERKRQSNQGVSPGASTGASTGSGGTPNGSYQFVPNRAASPIGVTQFTRTG